MLSRFFLQRNFELSPSLQNRFNRRHELAAESSFGDESAHSGFLKL